MTLKETLAQLKSLGNDKMRAHNSKHGAGDNEFGVKMGDIRTLAKKIKTDHELALQLWNTENIDGRLLAILIINPKKLSHKDLERLVKSENSIQVADWLYSYVIKAYIGSEAFREK